MAHFEGHAEIEGGAATVRGPLDGQGSTPAHGVGIQFEPKLTIGRAVDQDDRLTLRVDGARHREPLDGLLHCDGLSLDRQVVRPAADERIVALRVRERLLGSRLILSLEGALVRVLRAHPTAAARLGTPGRRARRTARVLGSTAASLLTRFFRSGTAPLVGARAYGNPSGRDVCERAQ